MNYYFEDFTEDNYREMLLLAKSNYRFIKYEEYQSTGRNILWRHDIDFSVNRAYSLAKIEASEGIQSTFFVHLHNDFYNALESEIVMLITEIIKLGHNMGLHFDPSFYGLCTSDINKLEDYLNFEKKLLEKILNVPIEVFSFHNPDVNGEWVDIEDEKFAGMINTNSRFFKDNYSYCSDSNGYWRYKRLKDMLSSEEISKLQVLTHPGWWVPESMSPRERIFRCIEGRAKKTSYKYDEILEKNNRKNIR